VPGLSCRSSGGVVIHSFSGGVEAIEVSESGLRDFRITGAQWITLLLLQSASVPKEKCTLRVQTSR